MSALSGTLERRPAETPARQNHITPLSVSRFSLLYKSFSCLADFDKNFLNIFNPLTKERVTPRPCQNWLQMSGL